MPSGSQMVFAVATSMGLGLLTFAAPSGRVLVGTPSTEKVVPDPSVRTGSTHRHHWFVVGGGYHGGK